MFTPSWAWLVVFAEGNTNARTSKSEFPDTLGNQTDSIASASKVTANFQADKQELEVWHNTDKGANLPISLYGKTASVIKAVVTLRILRSATHYQITL